MHRFGRASFVGEGTLYCPNAILKGERSHVKSPQRKQGFRSREAAMSDVLILGTDTDAGKTTLALLWLTSFGDSYEYWKPVETGPADSSTVANLVPSCARASGDTAVSASGRSRLWRPGWKIARCRSAASIVRADRAPQQPRHLLVETFGGPFSPLNEERAANGA